MQEWHQRFHEASVSLKSRDEKIAKVAEEIERALVLLGATAVEDRLQDGVPEAIALLSKAGIKVGLLSGCAIAVLLPPPSLQPLPRCYIEAHPSFEDLRTVRSTTELENQA